MKMPECYQHGHRYRPTCDQCRTVRVVERMRDPKYKEKWTPPPRPSWKLSLIEQLAVARETGRRYRERHGPSPVETVHMVCFECGGEVYLDGGRCRFCLVQRGLEAAR